MIKLVKSFLDIPDKVKNKIFEMNIFFGENFSEYSNSIKVNVWYIYDEAYIISINVYRKIIFRYAMFETEPSCYDDSIEVSKIQFIQEVVKRLKNEGIEWVGTSATALFDCFPKNSFRIPFGSHVINLRFSEEEIWKNIHSKHRNSIKRAEKAGVIIKTEGDSLIDDYVKMDNITWKRSGRLGYGKQFFKNIVDGLKEEAVIAIAYKENVPQAGAVFFVNKQMAYYMYGTSIDHPEPGSANFLHWEMIKLFKKIGVIRYSFVGCRINEDVESKYHGIQRFKERFGGELVQGYMWKVILNKNKYFFFRKLYKMKNGRELTDIIDEEIGKWTELNETSYEK